MNYYRREGECNRCGECCGTLGQSPFPSNWPEALRNWRPEDRNRVCPLIPMLNAAGKYRKSPTNAECPFLGDDPGDGTRPCTVVHTQAFIDYCKDEPTWPRSERHVNEWQDKYPSCSYTWVLIEE